MKAPEDSLLLTGGKAVVSTVDYEVEADVKAKYGDDDEPSGEEIDKETSSIACEPTPRLYLALQDRLRKRPDSQAPMSPYPTRARPSDAQRRERNQGKIQTTTLWSCIHPDRALWLSKIKNVHAAIVSTQ